MPPLYKLKKGKEVKYAYTEAEKAQIITAWGGEVVDVDADVEPEDGEESEDTSAATKGVKIDQQRYKGLGEMNADELGETTMNINNRILKQVTIEDGMAADKVFDILMGTDVPSRKSFIQNNARTANLDI
jgi:DNA gyrase subunit B